MNNDHTTTVYLLTATQKFLHRIIDGLTSDDLTAQPIPGINSISWIIGHLTLVDRRAIQKFQAPLVNLPEGYEAFFPITGQVADVQTTLPDVKASISLFNAHRTQLIELVKAMTPEQASIQCESRSGMFSTLGEMVAFFAVHTGIHIGQISSLRRALGKPPLF